MLDQFHVTKKKGTGVRPGRVRLNTEPGFFAVETLFDTECDTLIPP